MSLTYFTTRSKLAAYAFEWGKLLKCHLKGKSCIGQNIYDSEKWTQWFVFPPPTAIYMSADLVKGVFGHSSTFYAIKFKKKNLNLKYLACSDIYFIQL